MRVVRAPRRPMRRGFRPRGRSRNGEERKKCRLPRPPVRRLSRVARAPLIARPAHHRVVGEAYQGGRVRRAHLAKSLHGAGTRVRLEERAFGVNSGARVSALLADELPAGVRKQLGPKGAISQESDGGLPSAAKRGFLSFQLKAASERSRVFPFASRTAKQSLFFVH